VRKIRHLLEYVASRFGLFLLDRASLSSVEKLAVKLADAFYFLNRARRNIARQNIIRSGITADPQEADRIARESFRHFGILVVESLKSSEVLTEQNWSEHVELDIDPETMKIIDEPGRGVILVSGHFGNWEIATQIVSYLKPVTGITRDMNNPYTDQLMKERKPRNRFTITPKHGVGIDRLPAVLKNGQVLALMIDQHARERGALIDFFGIPASTHTSPAMLHLVTKAPICFGYCFRTGPMKFKFKAISPIIFKPTGNRENDVKTILELLTRELEKAIRANPEQYLWAHRRWKVRNPEQA